MASLNPPGGRRQLRVAEGVLVHEDGGEAFLLHSSTGRYFGLNRSGVVIWRALEAGGDAVSALGQRWPNVRRDQRERDVDALIERLREAGLVVDEPAP